jgi:Ulp1 family protease
MPCSSEVSRQIVDSDWLIRLLVLSLLSDDFGAIGPRDYRRLQPGRWANESIINWCSEWVAVISAALHLVYILKGS